MAHDLWGASAPGDDATLARLADRLEARASDSVFSGYRQAYLTAMNLGSSPAVLDLGTGTGVVARTVASRPKFKGRVVGVDSNATFIDKARARIMEAKLVDRVQFELADIHHVTHDDATFDAVILDTTLSHVADPAAVLSEATRVLRPGGSLVVFDGDYASWAFGCRDQTLGERMERAMAATNVTHPRLMRTLAALLVRTGLTIESVQAHVHLDNGDGRYWLPAVEIYGPVVAQAGLVDPMDVQRWIAEQRARAADNVFFAACNYYAYIVRKP